MEVIIAAIGGVCTLMSSLGSIYIDRRYNRNSEEDNFINMGNVHPSEIGQNNINNLLITEGNL